MKIINLLLVVIGLIIFAISFLSGGFLFYIPTPGPQLGWFAGLIFIALGLWLNEKDNKRK